MDQLSSLDKMVVNFIVNHLPRSRYKKALQKCKADQITIRREIDYQYQLLERQLYLQELLEVRIKKMEKMNAS